MLRFHRIVTPFGTLFSQSRLEQVLIEALLGQPTMSRTICDLLGFNLSFGLPDTLILKLNKEPQEGINLRLLLKGLLVLLLLLLQKTLDKLLQFGIHG